MCISELLFQVCAFNRTVSKVDEFMNNEAKGKIKFHTATATLYQFTLSNLVSFKFPDSLIMISRTVETTGKDKFCRKRFKISSAIVTVKQTS